MRAGSAACVSVCSPNEGSTGRKRWCVQQGKGKAVKVGAVGKGKPCNRRRAGEEKGRGIGMSLSFGMQPHSLVVGENMVLLGGEMGHGGGACGVGVWGCRSQPPGGRGSRGIISCQELNQRPKGEP